MEISPAAHAPPYRTLRPLLHTETSATFPVYQGLSNLLCTAQDPDDIVRHVLAVCAGYAYSDADTVVTMMARLGLEGNVCVRVASSVDAMFISSTAYIVQSEDRSVVILCYRGTEPANVISWLTDTDVRPNWVPFTFPVSPGQPSSGPGAATKSAVHGGFYRNVRATRYAVAGVLDRAIKGLSIDDKVTTPGQPLQALYVTGHSLGGAMAAMLAVMLKANPAYRSVADRLKAVYTYGQPMIGDQYFAGLCEKAVFNGKRFLADNLFRYICADDLVPRLPPREAGDFRHFGREFRCGPLPMSASAPMPTWSPASTATGQTNILGIGVGISTLLTTAFASLRKLPAHLSIVDHGPQNYLAALTPAGVRSEFGD